MSNILSRIAIGSAQFGMRYGIANDGGQISREVGQGILRLAAYNGINTIDTAIAYGDSEKRLGEIGVSDWRIVSKLPHLPDDCTDIVQWVTASVSGSMRRLNVSTLDGLLLHRPQQLVEKHGESLFSILQSLKHDGVVGKIGISIYDPSELDMLCSRFQFDLVQAPFNILDRRLIETGWLDRLGELGTELHVRSVFLQGLLLMSSAHRPEKFKSWGPLWSDWDRWLYLNGITPLQACLRYVLSFPQISKVIVGVDSPQQLREILSASSGDFPELSDTLKTSDLRLINPANWDVLT
ncbi:aldo/keto reductase [Chlorobium sp. BLA1]|uniref:aldo/keto reductase n=1 Tax=Candidatus Chlorobium masyuteum TaxID=2716876 RepID=UPI001423F6E6|nr:aldo/keto reductase [Candidatus Chlorobium masyuteum]NHQ59254.1 aldo/keto reductase [Candidatus Chlorobium masyuteum]